MRILDGLLGKQGKVVSTFINNSKIVEIVEVTSISEAPKKLDLIKKAISKQSGAYTIIALKD